MRSFQFSDDDSYKFWNIELQGKQFTVTYGRIGTKGQTQTKDFPDAAKAKAAHDKLVAEKLGKGYVETTAVKAAPSAAPLQQALEQALADNPDDLAAHSAYADYLMEHGDPRGEFIQVQLALEDPARPADERKQLQQREKALLKKHLREWLGDLGRFFDGKWCGPDKPYQCHFARGWLDSLRLLPYPAAVCAAIANAPEVRLLRRLEVVYDMRYHPFDFEEFVEGPKAALTAKEKKSEGEIYENSVPAELFRSPYLANLRVFRMGYSDDADRLGHSTMVQPFENCDAKGLLELLARAPRLEELYLNTTFPGIDAVFTLPKLDNIRILQYYYGSEYTTRAGEVYPLKKLAKNTSLGKLTHLRLHPGRETTIDLQDMDAILQSPNFPSLAHLQVHMTTFGDEGARKIVQSGILRRLKSLDIGYGNMTDAGARILIAAPDLKHLETLNVCRNALTDDGIAALQAVGIQVITDNQHDIEEEDYLYEVDFE